MPNVIRIEQPIRVGDVTFLFRDVPAHPERGGKWSIDAEVIERLYTRVAIELVRRGIATGPALQFLRKRVGLRAEDLGRMLAVSRETVSNWETGKYELPRATWAIVASMVLDRLDEPIRPDVVLEAAANPRTEERVELSA